MLEKCIPWLASFKFNAHYYFAPSRGCKVLWSACLYVCLFLCAYPLALSQKSHANFHQIFCTSYLWPWIGALSMAMRYIMLDILGFVDEIMFSYNAVNRAESETTGYVSSSLPAGGTGGEVCSLRLHLVLWEEITLVNYRLFLDLVW